MFLLCHRRVMESNAHIESGKLSITLQIDIWNGTDCKVRKNKKHDIASILCDYDAFNLSGKSDSNGAKRVASVGFASVFPSFFFASEAACPQVFFIPCDFILQHRWGPSFA